MDARKIACFFLILIVTCTGCSTPKSDLVMAPEPEYWPTRGWIRSSPEAQGMDSNLLAQMLEEISRDQENIHSILVIRNGYMVADAYFHPYTPDTKSHIQSVTKSIIGMLVGKAISQGYIKSEHEKLVEYYSHREYKNPGGGKNSIQLKHLLSMSSGLDCQEFSVESGMEQSRGWVQFMLDLPVTNRPGKVFGYCNGNAHLLSSILQITTGMSAREYANQQLFRPLGIPAVSESEWSGDPQGITTGGYGLHLRSEDVAKLAFLYLHNGKWDDQQIIPAQWIADSSTEHVLKEDGNGYGYLWTVYPGKDHYAALGLGGQQVHIYPSRNLIVVVTASLDSYAEAPEIEKMLNQYILPSIQADVPLAKNPEGNDRLLAVLDQAANPIQPVPLLPNNANVVSGSVYTFSQNPLGWKTLELDFEPGAPTAKVILDGIPVQVGLDNLYRMSDSLPGGTILLRGHWEDEQIFILEYPYPLTGGTTLGELGESQFRFKFSGDILEVTAQQLVFGGEPIVLTGSR